MRRGREDKRDAEATWQIKAEMVKRGKKCRNKQKKEGLTGVRMPSRIIFLPKIKFAVREKRADFCAKLT